jgi:hypothetical protein
MVEVLQTSALPLGYRARTERLLSYYTASSEKHGGFAITIEEVLPRLAPIVFCLPFVSFAQAPPGPPAIFPLSEVKAGMRGVGRTVFSGTNVEDFNVEILGVLENAGPKQNIILARLSGGPLDKTGVLQGMSGSPVYLDGRLAGAVALSFPFSKEPIAGIRPIEEMLQTASAPLRTVARANPFAYSAEFPAPASVQAGSQRLIEISTPLWLGGFTRSTLDHFAPQLRAAGLEPVQGASGGASSKSSGPAPGKLEPGSMISVQLITGDLSAGADGTVTQVDGDRIFAFGHRFLGGGETSLPFARAEVVTLLASLNSSFKISTSREWLGAILGDYSTAISGRIGEPVPMIPVSVTVHGSGGERRYRFQIVRDRLLTPLLSQMAIFSMIDATERVSGQSTIQASCRIALDGAPDVQFENAWSAETGTAQVVAAALAAPVAAITTSGFNALNLASITVEINVSNDRRELRLDSVWTSRRELHPGESFEVFARFTGEGGTELEQSVTYSVPSGAPTGTLNITVADGPTANIAEYRQFLGVPPRNAEQLVEFLNGLRTSRKAYVRLWRAAPTWTVQGETLPAPPASMTLLLARSALVQTPGAKVAELELPGGDFVFTGSKTVQVEVKD